METVAEALSALVLDSQLDSEVHPSHTIHFHPTLNANANCRVLERWSRERKLGNGAFGTVWLETCDSGTQQGLRRAVKEIRRMRTNIIPNNFARELEAAAKFSQARYNRHFVQSFGWYETRENIFLAMEYLPHGDLDTFLTRPFPEEETRAVTYQILEGLYFMQENGFAHRDLKPKNVLVKAPGPIWWVKVADFGISKKSKDCMKGSSLVVGTEEYMAPESKRIFPRNYKGPQTPNDSSAVDIWAVGLIAWRMLTNKPAFATPGDLVKFVSFGGPHPCSSASHSPACTQFMRKTLAATPEERPSAAEALQDTWIQGNNDGNAFTASNSVPDQVDDNTEALGYAEWDAEPPRQPGASQAVQAAQSEPRDQAALVNDFERMDLSDKDFNVRLKELRDKDMNAQAERLCRQTLSIRKQELGDIHPTTLSTAQHLADVLQQQDKGTESVSTLRWCLATNVSHLGEYHGDTQSSMMRLGHSLRFHKQYPEAESFYRKVHVIREQTFGKGHKDTVEALYFLALLSYTQGTPWDAQELFRRVLDLGPATYGDEHNYMQVARLGYANILYGRNRIHDAAPVYQELLSVLERVSGFEHVDTVDTAERLGNCFDKMGKLDEAYSLRRQNVEARGKMHGSESADTMKHSIPLAQSAFKVGQFAEAEALLRKTLPFRGPDEDQADVIRHQHLLALTLSCQKKLTEARPFFQKSVTDWKALQGTAIWETLDMVDGLVNTLCNLDYIDEARAEFLTVEDLREQFSKNRQWRNFSTVESGREKILSMGINNKHFTTMSSIQKIADQLQSQGRWAEEGIIRFQLLKTYTALLKDDHALIIQAAKDVSSNLTEQGQHEQADFWFRKAFTLKYPPGNDQRGGMSSEALRRGSWLMSRAHYKEAEYYCVQACAAGQSFDLVAGSSDWFTRVLSGVKVGVASGEALNLLATCYMQQSRYSEAESSYQQASAARGGPVPPEYKYTGNFLSLDECNRRVLSGRSNRDGIFAGCKSIHGYGLALYHQGQHQKAEAAFRAILKILNEGYSNDGKKEIYDVQYALAASLECLKKYDEAEGMFKSTFEGRRKILGGMDGETMQAGSRLASVLEKQGNHEEAAQVDATLGS